MDLRLEGFTRGNRRQHDGEERTAYRVGVTSGEFSAATRLRLLRRRRWVREGIEEGGSPRSGGGSTVEGRNKREKPKKKNGEWIMDSDGNITCSLILRLK